jgi:hypothetical protein
VLAGEVSGSASLDGASLDGASLDRACLLAERLGADPALAARGSAARRPAMPGSRRRQRGLDIARASLAPGSDLAKLSSMPIAAIVASTDDRP